MSFLRLAEREVEITQSMLLGSIFPDDIPDTLVPVIESEVTQPTPNTGLIALPNNTSIQLATNESIRIYTCVNNVYITNGTIGPDQVQTNSIWVNATATTPASLSWPYFQEGTASTTRSCLTQTSTGIYQTAANNFIYFNTNPNIPIYSSTRVITGKSKPQEVKKPIKNSIKRALKLLDNFGMEEDTKIFLKGDEIEISHPDSLFKFVITKSRYNSVINRTERPGHGIPFGLELFTKSGIHVSNLCVYAVDTPMLDQLFMVAMYVKSGNEEDLLREANFFGITQDTTLKELIVSEVDYLEPKLLPKRKTDIYINRNLDESIITNSTLVS